MPEYLTIAQTAEMTGLKPAHLARLRYLGSGPKYLRLTPRVIRYRRQDVTDFMEASLVEPARSA